MLAGYELTDPLPDGVPQDNATAAHTCHYVVDLGNTSGNDYEILENRNGLCVIRLARRHALYNGGGIIECGLRIA